MRKYGYLQSNSYHTLFLKHRQGKVTALIVYVDDMIITGDDAKEISRLQEELSTEFEMKNLGGLKYSLGIENHGLGEFSDQVSVDKGKIPKISGYTDADWARDILDIKSTSGYFTFVGGNLVT
ncbi:hypothetical protein CK203_035545 [Vitis vinifera]|uniref:Reverse transcriptase Ty1/copia-type domain-containing protein n=1 Tax=Vitis vinifera TaxID=29760 RepID=A0A438HPP3_VITVI|nr:hypothetical protein CK203_035545 [Vitis vinifera]